MFCNSSSTFLLYLCGGLGSAGRLGSGLVNFIAIRRLCCSQVPTPGILSLIIYRTKAESSRETPDFDSKCMASVLLFANLDEAMHLDFASLHLDRGLRPIFWIKTESVSVQAQTASFCFRMHGFSFSRKKESIFIPLPMLSIRVQLFPTVCTSCS